MQRLSRTGTLANLPSRPGGEMGRRKGLKIPWRGSAVWVRIPPRALLNCWLRNGLRDVVVRQVVHHSRLMRADCAQMDSHGS